MLLLFKVVFVLLCTIAARLLNIISVFIGGNDDEARFYLFYFIFHYLLSYKYVFVSILTTNMFYICIYVSEKNDTEINSGNSET